MPLRATLLPAGPHSARSSPAAVREGDKQSLDRMLAVNCNDYSASRFMILKDT